MNTNQTIVALLALVSAVPAYASSDIIGFHSSDKIADDWSISTEFNLFTDHSDSTYTEPNGKIRLYNESNQLVSAGVNRGYWSLGASTFENSYFDRSYMLSVERDVFYVGDFNLTLGMGVVTGYKVEILRDDTFFVGDLLLSPLTTLEYKADWLSFLGVNFTPKLRMMGLDTYMFNLELSYSLK